MIGELEEVTGRSVSRETFEKLRSYATLLRTEAAHQNLVSASTLDHLWERHVLDSAQLVRFAPESSATWLDVGSGAGLPGIVLACLIDSPIALVEPRRLRADFLRRVAEELGLNVSVHQAKIERITGKFDVITGRAVAALPKLLSMCDHLSTRKTRWVLPKGRTAQSELAEARSSWQGVFHVEPSVTDEDSRIIVATGVRAKRQ